MKNKNLIKRLTSILLVLLLIFGDVCSALGPVTANAEGVDIPINIIDYTDPANHPANNDMFASTVPGENTTANTAPLRPNDGSSVSANSTLGANGTGGTGSVSATPGSGTTGGTAGSNITIVNPDGSISFFPSFGGDNASGELTVTDLIAGSRYAVVNEKPMSYTIGISGGTAPYHVHFAVRLNGDICFEQREDLPEAGQTGFEWIPVLYGEHDVAVTVKDAMGKTISKGRSIPVAVWETEDFDEAVSGVELTGDWAADVVAIASSQLGHAENKRNFRIDENGTSYYSMYSHWCYGDPFAPWETAFVLYCIDKAGVPEKSFPRSADVAEWISTLQLWGLFNDADTQPVAGDVAFFANGSVGIVAAVQNDMVYIIDGDRDDCDKVAQYTHAIGDGSIIGYGRLGTVQTNPSDYVAPAKPLTDLVFTSSAQTGEVGETVTFTAVIPEGVDASQYIWQWQMSPDGVNWIDVEGAQDYVWTVQTTPAHYLNYIRVVAQPAPQPQVYARSFMMALSNSAAATTAANDGSVASAPMMLSVRASVGQIYWNPYGSPTFSEDGVVIVAPGADSNDGTSFKSPVLNLATAVSLAGPDGKTIVCMNLYNSYADDSSLASAAQQIAIIGYDGGNDPSAAHEGQYFSSKSGTLTLQNIYVEETESVLELDGGKVKLGTGVYMPGPIFINSPTANLLPMVIEAANEANSGVYTVNFNPDYVGDVGIASGNHTASGTGRIQLDQSLIDRGWQLTVKNGATYANIPPEYEAIYLDGLYGHDDNFGNSPEKPVRTLKRAQELLAQNSGKVTTIYVTGTVTIDAAALSFDTQNSNVFELASTGANEPKLIRHSRCTGPMFKLTGGEKSFSLTIDNSESGDAVFEVSGGTLKLDRVISITGATATVIKMSGGDLAISGAEKNITGAATIVSGNAGNVTITNSALTASGSVVDLATAKSFTTTGTAYTGSANNTLAVSGTASIGGGTTVQVAGTEGGLGSVRSYSGSLEVDGVNLNRVGAASSITLKNCAISTIENTGSSTTLDAVTGVSSLTAAGTLTIQNGSVVANAISTGSSVTVADSNVTGTLEAAGTATVNGTLAADGNSSTATIGTLTAQGNTAVTGAKITNLTSHGTTNSVNNSTVDTLSFDGTSTITNTAITLEATTAVSTINNGEKNIAKLTASGNTTLTSGSVSMLICNGGDVIANDGSIAELSLNGASSALVTAGKASTPNVALVGNNALIKLSGAPTDKHIQLTITNEYNGRVVVQGNSYNASQHITVKDPANSLFQRAAGGSDSFWLDIKDNDIILTAPTGVYVQTDRDEYKDPDDTSLGKTAENPVKTFAEAVQILKDNPSLPRIIYVIGEATIADGDTLNPSGTRVTVMPYDNRADTLIKVPANVSFVPSNVDFDGAGLASGSTLINAAGTFSTGSAQLKNADTLVNMASGSSVTLTNSTLTPNTNGTGIRMAGGTLNASGSIKVSGSGKGLDMENGTATISSRIDVDSSSGLGINATGGKLNFNGSVYGYNAITVKNAVVDSTGYTYSTSGSSSSSSYGKVTIENSTLNVKGGSITSLSQTSGTTNISSSGHVEYMTMNDGVLNITGGSLDYLTHKKGSTRISGGTVSSSTVTAGDTTVSGSGKISSSITLNGSALAGATLDVLAGSVGTINHNGGTVTVTGGTVSTANVNNSDSRSRIFANGGSISTAHMYGTDSILHTNGSCNLGTVYLGDTDGAKRGANAHIALSGPVTKSGKINIIVGDVNYYENYSVVKPEAPDTDATDQLEKFSIDSMKKRFNLAAGMGDKSTHIVLAFDGVFIDTQNGLDTNDGLTYSTAVKTFKRAGVVMAERLEKDSSLVPVIYVVNKTSPYTPATAIVSGDDTLDMTNVTSNNGKVYVSSFNSACDLLVSVPSGASLTVINADLDGVGNNAGLQTTSVLNVAGTFTINDGDVKNGRGTVMTVSGTANLSNADVYPYEDNRTTTTAVKINNGTLNLNNSSNISYGNYGVDMDGGTLNISSGSVRYANTDGIYNKGGKVTVSASGSVSSNYGTGVNMTSGTLDLNGGSISSNYLVGVKMSGGSFTMPYGTISSNGRSSRTGSLGGVYMTGGEFDMSDGTIGGSGVGNRSNSTGGGVTVSSGASFTMSGGTISYNSASGNGGGVSVNGGSFTMSGSAELTNNTSSANGGGLYAAAGSTIKVNGTTSTKLDISYNTASNGGGIYYSCGLTDPIYVNLTHNTATSNGGGIYINGNSTGHSHTLKTFTITNNTAKGNGGGLYNNCSATVDISGTALNNNTATNNGGAVYSAKGELTGDSSTKLNDSSASNGGALYVAGGSVSLREAKLSSSRATSSTTGGNGGAVYVAGGTVDLTGARLSDCTVNYTTSTSGSTTSYNGGKGGAVYVSGGTVTLDNATLGASGAAQGGALYVAGGSVSMSSATVDFSTAEDKGTAIYQAGGTVNFNGSLSGGGELIYTTGDSIFNHQGGTVSGNVTAGGSYVLTLPAAKVTGTITLSNAVNPLKISENSTTANNSSYTVKVQEALFIGAVIVDGFKNLPAKKDNFKVVNENGEEISNITEKNYDILGGEASDVFWDPADVSKNAQDADGYGVSPAKPCKTMAYAVELLSTMGPTARIIMCSGVSDGGAGSDGPPERASFALTRASYSDSNGYNGLVTGAAGTEFAGKQWRATLIRGLNSAGNALTGNMFSEGTANELKFSNLIISGEYYEGTHTTTGALVAGQYIEATNVDFCNNNSSKSAVENVDSPYGTLEFTNCKFYDNVSSGNGGAVNVSENSESVKFENTDFYRNSAYIGGAVYIENSATNVTITGCTFEDNNSTRAGGALRVDAASNLEVKDTDFIDNKSGYSNGGAIYVIGCGLSVENSTFTGNAAAQDSMDGGGAIYVENGDLSVENSTFTGNSSGLYVGGGAIYIYRGGLSVENSTFIGNATGQYCSDGGGAIFYAYSANSENITIKSSKFIENKSSMSGGAIQLDDTTCTLTIEDSVFTGNEALASWDGGGGAVFAKCDVSITGGSFEGNKATAYGGAVYEFVSNTTVTVNGTAFSANSAGEGGALYLSSTGVGAANLIVNRHPTTGASSTFAGNYAASSGAAIYFGGAEIAPMADTIFNITGAYFTGNYCGSQEAPTGEIIYIGGQYPASITDSIIGNQAASTHPASSANALATGGNSALSVINAPNCGLTLSDTYVVGNYASNGAVKGGSAGAMGFAGDVNITGGSVSYNSHDGVVPNAACATLRINGASVSGNGDDGLDTSSLTNLTALELTASSFDGNACYGAYVPKIGSNNAAIGSEDGGRTSFNNNGISGLYIDADYFITSEYPLTIRNAEFVGNGSNDAQGRGLHLMDSGANDSSGTGKVKLINTTVSNNGSSTTTKGGGVYVGEGVNLLLDSSVTISGNEADRGGAIYWEDHATSGNNNAPYEQGNGATLSGNKAKYGGAIYADKNVTLGGFNILNNEAELGGGLYVAGGAVVKVQKDSGDVNTVFKGNEAELGGAIYLAASDSSELDLNAAIISGNSSTGDVMSYALSGLSSGIYNGAAKLHMAGSNVDISDNIYLHNKNFPITLTASMSRGVIYNIALNMMGNSNDTSLFNYGDVVVGPSDGYKNAAQWLRYTEEVIPGNVFAKGRGVSGSVDSIVLKRCLFVDGINGQDGTDGHDGETPSKAFKTMEHALNQVKDENYVIYICGPVYPASENSTWAHNSLPIEIHRYTGFAIGGESSFDSYDGDLVVIPAGYTLTIGQNINSIAGWHDPADPATPYGSIFNVNGGGTLNFSGTTTLEGNSSSAQGGAIHIGHDATNATVNVSGNLTISDISGVNGGAICVDEGSQLNIEASGTLNVSGSSAVNGGAIYNSGTVTNSGTISIHNSSASSNGDAIYNVGTLMLNNGSTLDTVNEVYITNNAFITLQSSNVTLKGTSYSFDDWGQEQAGPVADSIPVSIGDPRDGRIYARYLNDEPVVSTEQAKYALPNSIKASFLLKSTTENEGSALDLILSQSNVVYVDPAYTGGDKPSMTKGYSPDYPFTNLYDAYEKLNVGDLKGGLIYIVTPITITSDTVVGINSYSGPDGSVTLSSGGVNIRRYSKPTSYVDDNNQRSFTKETNLDQLFIVQSHTLTLDGVIIDGHEFAITNSGPETKFTIAPAVTADKPAVTVSGGMLKLTNGAQLTGNASNDDPSAIYNGAGVTIDGKDTVTIDGTVFLKGDSGIVSDSFITVNDASVSPVESIDLRIDDPEDGRRIAKYSGTPDEGELNKYKLPASTMEGYKLAIDGNYIVMRVNNTVYVDGVHGDDSNVGTPDEPVATLREAYLRLQANGGTIYIVDTVSVAGSVSLTLSGSRYSGGSDDVVVIDSGSVSIKRYSKPSASTEADPIEGYEAPSNSNPLINISGGSTLSLSNIIIDGHKDDFTGSQTTTAPAATSTDAMIVVGNSGILRLDGAVLRNNNNAESYGTGGALRITGTGSVSMVSGSSIVGNSAAYGAGIFNAGTLTMAGNVSFGEDQWVYANFINRDNYPYIGVNGELTGTVIPVQLRDEAVSHGIIIAKYGSALTPNAERFKLTEDNNNRMTTYSLAKTTKDKDVLILAGYNVTYKLTDGIKKGNPAPDRAAREENFTAFIAQGEKGLPDNVTVQITYVDDNGENQTKTLIQGTDFTYDSSTGQISIPANNVIGHITITAAGVGFNTITYEYTIGGITPAANNPVGRRGSDSFTANFTLTEGYVEPTVTVTVNDETVDATRYSYIDGVFTLLPGGAEGNVHVKLETRLIDYSLIVDFENAHVDDLTGSNNGIITVDGELRVQHETTITGTVVVDNAAASTLPETIQVYINGYLVDEDEYEYDSTSGDFSIPGALVTADVEIRGAAPTNTYTISYTLSPENILVPITDAPVSVPYGQAVSTGIEINGDNVLLPETITVKVDGTELTSGYTYSKDTGLITINGNEVDGDIEIIADGIHVYTVTTNFTGVVATSVVPTTVVQGNGISFTVTGDTGYKLPDSITVTIGDNAYTDNAYDKATGKVRIPAAAITGNVVITIEGLPVYNVSYDLTNLVVEAPIPTTVDQGQPLEFTLKADPNKGGTINLPTTVTVTGAENETYDVTDGKVTIPADEIKGHLKVVAVGTQTFTVTAQPVNVKADTLVGATLTGNGTCATAAYTATAVEAATGYVLPDSISVTYNGDATKPVSGFTWSVTNGKGTLTVPAASITDHITVTITAVKEHTVTFVADPTGSVNLPEAVKVVHGAALPSQTVTAQRGYKLTGILVDGDENSSYVYTPTVTNDEALSATVSAAAGVVTGDVTITVKAEKRTYSITETVTNADVPRAYDASDANDAKDKDATVTDGAEFTATIKADNHYELPSSITVKIGDGQTLTINGDGEPGASDITYVKTTGVLTIPENVIIGPVVIGGAAVPKTYTISYDTGVLLDHADVTQAVYNETVSTSISVKTDVTVKGTVTLPDSVTVKDANGNDVDHTYTNGTITFAPGAIKSNITITALGVQSFSVTTNFNNEATATTAFPASVSASEGTAKDSVTGTVQANDGYVLDASCISVTDTASNKLAFTYNNGTITVDKSVIKDNITITVDPLKVIPVTYKHVDNDGNASTGSSGSSTPATVTEGTGLTASFTLSTGYEYVDNDAVVVNGLASGAVYSFNEETHTLTVDAQYITGSLDELTVTVVTKLKDYEVIYDGTLTQPDDDYRDKDATHGQDFTTVIEPATDPDGNTEDVRLPDSITVTVEGIDDPLTEDIDYTYDPETGTIVINGGKVVGSITITANGVRQYDVDYVMDDLLASIDAQLVDEKAASPEVTISAATGMNNVDLPETVNVTMESSTGTITLTADTDYSYDSSTGKFSIKANVITGDVTVTAEGRQWYTVTYQLSDNSDEGSATLPENVAKIYSGEGHTDTIVAAFGYEISNVTVTMGGTDIKSTAYTEVPCTVPGLTDDILSGTISITAVTGDVVITVSTAKRVYTVTEDNDNYDIESEQDFIPDNDVIDVEHNQGSGDDEDKVTITIDPEEGYLPPDPEDLVIKVIDPVDGTETVLDEDDDYTYDPETGKITIDPDVITGPIVISGDAVPLYDVTFMEKFGDEDAKDLGTTVKELTVDNPVVVKDETEMSTVSFTAEPGYQIVSVTMDGTELSTEDNDDYTYSEDVSAVVGDITGGSLSINSVTADTEIVINTAKRVYDVTNSGDNTTIGSDDDKDDDEEGIQLEHGDSGEEGTDDDVVITVTPDTGYDLPEDITITIKDPDDPDAENEPLGEDDYTYDPETGEITIHVPITGPVEIDADATIKTFAITEDITHADAEDKTDSENPVEIPETGDAHKVEYGQEVKVQVNPEYGYNYPETITVTIDGVEIDAVVEDGEGNEKTNYSYNPETGELVINPDVITGPVVIGGEAKHKVYDVTYVLAETGEDANLKVDEEYEDKKPVHDEAFTTVILPVSDSILLPDEIEITMTYEDEEGKSHTVTLRPEEDDEGNKAQYTYEIVDVNGEKQGQINIPANVIKGDIVINAIGIDTFDITLANLTLTAVDDETRLDSTKQWKSEARNLLEFEDTEGNKIITMERLRGKTFTITSVTPSTGLSLDEKDDVLAKQFTAGSDYANSTFGLTLMLNNGTEIDMKDGATITFAENATQADLSFTLYNANALTEPGQAGTVTVTLTSNAGDVINLAVNITRITSQINVTVPLVMVLKTNIDGGSATVADSSYYLDNNSSMRLALTDVDLDESSREGHTGIMKYAPEATDAQLLNMRDSFKVYFKAWTGTELAADDAKTGANAGADTYNPIEKVATSPLTFVTNANEAYGIHMATVTYTVSIPTGDAAVDSTTGSGK